MADFIIWNSYTSVLPGQEVNRAVRPLGPHVLASWLLAHGFSVKVIDFCNLISPSDLAEITSNYIDSKTIAVGVSNTFWGRKLTSNFFEPLWLIESRKLITQKNPKLNWIMGGYNTEKEYKINYFTWDHITHRFAENQILKYLDEKRNQKMQRHVFDIVSSESKFMDGLGITPDEVLPLELARGCQFKCMFCVYDVGKEKNSYIKNFKNVENEILSNYYRYGTTRYIIVEETVNESEEKINSLAELAAKLPFKLEWVGFNRLDLIGNRPNALEAIEHSGMKGSFFGIESFGRKTSQKIGKGWNGVHAKDYLLYLRERWDKKISWTLSFIIGLMDDTVDDIEESQRWLIDNKMLNWSWWPLHIKNNKFHYSNRHTSLLNGLDLNYEKYGYEFYDKYLWRNKHWSYETAQTKAFDLRKEAKPYLTMNVWSATEIASAGFPLVETLFSLENQINYSLINNQVQAMVDSYVQYQKNFPGY